MIRIRQIKIDIKEDNIKNIKSIICKKLNVSNNDILKIEIIKKSIDARKKPLIYFVYEIDVEISNEDVIMKRNKSLDILIAPSKEFCSNITGNLKLKHQPIIVGAGPAGLFCAYMLASKGYKPIIIERGKKVEDRIKDVEEFWKSNKLNTNSNVLFGEGGAGTFSDGKLNTLVKDNNNRQRKVLEIFVENGAPAEILYENKPHIGTDLLRNVVKNMRINIETMGGTFKYNTVLTNIIYEDDKLVKIEINNQEYIDCDLMVLAIGHSARDTFEMLYNNKINMQAKPFAVGIRIEHPQKMINYSQYGLYESDILPAASYKLTNNYNNRGIYTFCMCPGGYVVNSSSEEGMLSINGMSNYKRESLNANSAIIVTVTPDDFGKNALDGVEFQRSLERKAYDIGKGMIPIQLYKDYKNNIVSKNLGTIEPIFKGNYTLANINDIFPKYINESIINSIETFDKKIKGYATGDAIIAGVESRTSSPVRIIRDDNYESNIHGIYPCGEGAGYAGGITSAAIDGIKVYEKIITKYKI